MANSGHPDTTFVAYYCFYFTCGRERTSIFSTLRASKGLTQPCPRPPQSSEDVVAQPRAGRVAQEGHTDTQRACALLGLLCVCAASKFKTC